MTSFEDRYLEAVIEAQKLKLAKGQVSHEVFAEAVMNIHQLLSLAMPNPERGAREEADKEWQRLQALAKKTEVKIKEGAKVMDEDDRAWKPDVQRAKASWTNHDSFLTFLISVGHRYNLFPRAGPIEAVAEPTTLTG